MDRAVSQWTSQTGIATTIETALTRRLNKSYTIYGCMILLPPAAFEGPEWDKINTTDDLEVLYQCIGKHLKVTHIAINKPIPLNHDKENHDAEKKFNILRSPTSFTPLHGDFGPLICSSPPTASDFDQAFWVTAKQNGIYQTWAPRWTMFSRGNISEKARLLTLPSVLQAVVEGEFAAVDLYAGIGYFAFSYVKAGVRQVLCWDLNPWSCEGLRRGAKKNGWEVVMYNDQDSDELEEARLVVFNESNEHAPARIESVRDGLLPVRHVNCGMLPSSRDSLELAARILEAKYLGWVHVHENFLVEDIERKAEETRTEFTGIVERLRGRKIKTEIEYINRLKSYAPGDQSFKALFTAGKRPSDPQKCYSNRLYDSLAFSFAQASAFQTYRYHVELKQRPTLTGDGAELAR